MNANNSAQVAATAYTITPAPASGSTIARGTVVSLPITFTPGTALTAALQLKATLGSGLTGTFTTSAPSGVAITGSGPFGITIAAGNYPGGVNLTFTPNAIATDGTITFNHNGGGAGFTSGSGSEPGPFNYTVTNLAFSSATVLPTGTSISVAITIATPGGQGPLMLGTATTQNNSAGFTVTADGTPVTVSRVTVAGSTITLNLSGTVYAGQTVTVAYASGGVGDVQDSAPTPTLSQALLRLRRLSPTARLCLPRPGIWLHPHC